MEERRKILAGFVEALRRSIGFEFNVNRFDHRLRLQKLVYLAKTLDVPNLEYDFNLYLRGPYSPELADDYYHLDKDFKVGENYVNAFLNDPSFKKLVRLVKGKDGTWLEIAATLVELSKVVDNLTKIGLVKDDEETTLIAFTYNRKPFVTRKYIKEVLEELKYHKVI